MAGDDPFGIDSDDERTRLVPRPGGTRRRTQEPEQAPPAPRSVTSGSAFEPFASAVGVNALLTMATPLLVLCSRLANTVSHPDPDALRAQVAEEVDAFSGRAAARGLPDEDVFVARYVLCTALDEAVLNTPWGAESNWHRDSLLVSFHGEADGGDKFFVILDRMNRDPARNLPLLELMYTCLSLGFQGRYRLHADGLSQLAEIRERIYQTLRRFRDRADRQLSPHWKGVTDRKNALVRGVPLWALAAMGLALLLFLYWSFSTTLNARSDLVARALGEIKGEQVVTRSTPPAPVEVSPASPAAPREADIITTLQELLAEDIAAEQLEIIATNEHVMIRLRGDGLFVSGRASVKSTFLPTLGRVAAALDAVSGSILVTGHSDSVPIRTIRFPSNWHLSEARAKAVAGQLAKVLLKPGRLIARGRADNERIEDPDDTAAKRARNRRVEIVVSRPSLTSRRELQ